jgi:hypothetical protein
MLLQSHIGNLATQPLGPHVALTQDYLCMLYWACQMDSPEAEASRGGGQSSMQQLCRLVACVWLLVRWPCLGFHGFLYFWLLLWVLLEVLKSDKQSLVTGRIKTVASSCSKGPDTVLSMDVLIYLAEKVYVMRQCYASSGKMSGFVYLPRVLVASSAFYVCSGCCKLGYECR